MPNALRSLRLVAFGAVTFSLPPVAQAALGHAVESVQADRVHMSAKLASTAAAAYTTHVLTLANGGTVKEFAAADGVVFAVAWQGPARPDLKQLLGEHFDAVQADNVARTGVRHARRALGVSRTDFVLHSGGHSGAFWGRAYLPPIVPAGVSSADLH